MAAPNNQVVIMEDLYTNFNVTDVISPLNTINVTTNTENAKLIDINFSSPNTWLATQSYSNGTSIMALIDPATGFFIGRGISVVDQNGLQLAAIQNNGSFIQKDTDGNILVQISSGVIQLFKVL